MKFKRKRCFKVPEELILKSDHFLCISDSNEARCGWKMGFGLDDSINSLIMSKNPFLLPPEFYKNLFAASAILQKPNQTQNDCNKLFNAQNFPRNLLFSCGDDKEVSLSPTDRGFRDIKG